MMLGKRKRDTVVLRRESKPTETDAPQINPDVNPNDVFRKYFESTFDPIAVVTDSTPSLLEDESDEESEENLQELLEDDDEYDDDSVNSEWSGFSETADEVPVVEVIAHGQPTTNPEDEILTKTHKKSFMSTAPPREPVHPSQRPNPPTEEDQKEDATNLKHDLDLQRLLRESHLLEKSKTSSNPGKHRHVATDMRLQTLGSKSSIYKQEKMPLSHLVGIRRKAVTKEDQRRRDARENGIVLEKRARGGGDGSGSGSGKGAVTRRDRGVDVPVLGRFRGGTLKLSRDDIFSIQGGGSAGGGGNRGGGRSGRGGGNRGGKKKSRR